MYDACIGFFSVVMNTRYVIDADVPLVGVSIRGGKLTTRFGLRSMGAMKGSCVRPVLPPHALNKESQCDGEH